MSRPTSLKELFEFYYTRFKPIYCHVQTLNEPPIEMFFEINAAFDHLSRHWYYGEAEETIVHNVAAHLKRGTFDAFKIILRETRDQYDELRQVDTSLIDNGKFEPKMLALFADIKEKAGKARLLEGDSRSSETWDDAFDLWEEVYADCVRFEKDYFLSSKVEWAKKKQSQTSRKKLAAAFLLGIITSLVGQALWTWLVP
jgi:hypothetical protein